VIHLDTNVLIRALLPGSAEDRRMRAWLRDGADLGMSAIAWTEFLCGPVKDADVDLAARAIPHREPFTPEDGTLAAALFNSIGRRRGRFVDCLIAATAIRVGASLATANLSDYRGMEAAGLILLRT